MKKLIFLSCCLLVAGCNSQTSPSNDASTNSAAPETPVVSDDATAVETLAGVGAKTKTDKNGLIIEVNLRDTSATDETLAAIAPLTQVRSLLLNDLEITDVGLAALKDVEWPLANIDLRGCPVSNAGLAHLTGLKTLKAVRLSGTNSSASVDDDGMAALAQLPNLKVLSLDKLWVSELGLEELTGLEHLAELYLAETTISDDGMALFAKFAGLKKLRLSKNQISNDGLAHLAGVSGLEELDLSEVVQISDDGMAHLSGLTALKKLNLWRTPIGDAGVEHLKTLVNLQWLNLDNTSLTDAGLPSLKDMNQLTFLHLGSTQISDAGLPHLTGLTTLEDLKVTRTAVTADGVAELQKSLSKTAIQLEYLGNN